MRPLHRSIASVAIALLPVAAPATVVASGPSGFVVHVEALYPGDADTAWRRLVRPQLWWDPDHTYSHDAGNLSLALEPGGCFCERLADGGFVRHMEVVYAAPGQALRLVGGLGPLQRMGASGTLAFTLKSEAPNGTRIIAEYAVSGYSPAGLAEIAGAVDAVLGAQLARLAARP